MSDRLWWLSLLALASAQDVDPLLEEPSSELERTSRRLASGVVKKTVFPIELVAGGWRQGSDSLQLWRPYGVASDGSGGTYVADTMNHRIQHWPLGGSPLTLLGGFGGGLDQLKFPRGLFLDSGGLYIADSGNHRVLRWDIAGGSGTVVAGELGVLYDRQGLVRGNDASCCRGGAGTQQLQNPHDVVVLGGDLYVADTGNDRVQKISSSVATTVAGAGMSSPGANSVLKRPEGVFATSTHLYVSDTGQQRVVRYPLAGGAGVIVAPRLRSLKSAAILTSTDVWQDLHVVFPASRKSGGHLRGRECSGAPQELGVPIKNVYVVDSDNHRVMRVRDDTQAGTLVAGGCLESPSYIEPCIQGGLHDPLRPNPDDEEALNPSSDNPPIYHFYAPSGLHVSLGSTVNLTLVDTLNHRVLTWYT